MNLPRVIAISARRQWPSLGWVVFTLLAAALFAADPAHAAKATISVTPVTPRPLNVTVGHTGRVAGNHAFAFEIKRTQKPTGVLGSCHKIEDIELYVDSYLYKTIKEKNQSVGYLRIDPPLCTFSKRMVNVTPISDAEFRSTCADVKGRTVKHITHYYGVRFADNSGWGIDSIDVYSGKGSSAAQRRRFTARVECLGPLRGHATKPRGRPANAKCDITGSWPVWLANGSQRQPIPFVADGKATADFYRAKANASRVNGHATVRYAGGEYQLIVDLYAPGHPETYGTFFGRLDDWHCDRAEGIYCGHNGRQAFFEGHYVMQRLKGKPGIVRSPVGHATAPSSTSRPSPVTPTWRNRTPQIPNWRKRP